MATIGPMEPVIALEESILPYSPEESLYAGCTMNQASLDRIDGNVRFMST